MPERFQVGGIVQLGPNTRCPGGLAVITEVRDWGVICYMQLPGPCEGITITVDNNRAWFRLKWEDITATGGMLSTPNDKPTR